MRVDLLSREYPPAVYGGAGVHVAELAEAAKRTGALLVVQADPIDAEQLLPHIGNHALLRSLRRRELAHGRGGQRIGQCTSFYGNKYNSSADHSYHHHYTVGKWMYRNNRNL